MAWLNRSNIIFAGEDKWSLDPRVDLVTKGQLEYSLRIQKVIMTRGGGNIEETRCKTVKKGGFACCAYGGLFFFDGLVILVIIIF